MGDWDLTMVVGDRVRLARDSDDGTLIPSDLSFSTSWQGGHRQADCSLLRSLSSDGGERPFDPVKIYGPGGVSVWEGRLQRMPRTVTRTIQRQSPQAIGLCGILEDRQDARFLGIDRDLGRWGGQSLARRAAILATPYKPLDAVQANGSLRLSFDYAWTTLAGRPYIEAVYSSGPVGIGRVVCEWQGGAGISTGQSSANPWFWDITTGPTTEFTSITATQSLVATHAAGAWVQGSLVTPTAYAARLALAYGNSPAGTANTVFEVSYRNVGVVGDHGLTLTGTGAADYGIKASDAITWLVNTYCPGLQVGEVVDSGLGIQHLALLDPQSPGQILNAINAYHAWAWGVWEDGRVDYGPYGGGRSRTWYVRAGDDGVELSQDGDDAAALWTDIVVSYTDPTGKLLTVGAPGTIADQFDASLAIVDPTHPAVAAGVRRVYHFALDSPTILSTATAVGQTMLAQLNAARRAGSATLQGYVTDESYNRVPAYMVRGGDQLVITDIGDQTPRRIVDTNYTHASKSVQCTLDNTLQTVEAIIAHLGARSTGRI